MENKKIIVTHSTHSVRSGQVQKLIVLAGPTASGKTDLAKYLAKKYKGEVISADSRQVYIGMDLGTGKDKSFKQHLIDVVTPNKQFTVAEFQKKATKIIDDIAKRGKTPFLVGGTAFYIDAIAKGVHLAPKIKNKKLRASLEKKTNKALWNQLKKLDPQCAETIDKNNKRRLVRALEVCIDTGKPFSSFKRKKAPIYNTLYIAINIPRDKLHKMIDVRVDKRIKQGMIKEVEGLLKKYPNKRIKEFGLEYRFITEYLEGKLKKDEMIERLKFATHAYARRQLTWLRKNKDIVWVKNQSQAEKSINKFLK